MKIVFYTFSNGLGRRDSLPGRYSVSSFGRKRDPEDNPEDWRCRRRYIGRFFKFFIPNYKYYNEYPSNPLRPSQSAVAQVANLRSRYEAGEDIFGDSEYLYSTDDERVDERIYERPEPRFRGVGSGSPGRTVQLVRPERSFFDTLASFSWGLAFGGAPRPIMDEAA